MEAAMGKPISGNLRKELIKDMLEQAAINRGKQPNLQSAMDEVQQEKLAYERQG
jgi:hypothetical protein